MKVIRLIFLSMMIGAWTVPLLAQKSDAAEKQAGSWFNNARDTFLKRLSASQVEDLNLLEAAAKKVGFAMTRGDLGFAQTKFNPLWDRVDKPVPGAIAKYAKRWSKFQEQWLRNGKPQPVPPQSMQPSA